MNRPTHQPFDEDVRRTGAYAYTDGSQWSTRIANERYTGEILAAAEWRGKRVVDVGAGDGAYTVEIARRAGAESVMGIEPAAQAVASANDRYGDESLHFEHGTSADLIERGEHFDIAVYRGVLHHVADAPTEVAQALRLASRVIFLEPNGWNPMMKAVEKLSRYHREHGERSFRPGTVAHWVRDAGGTVERIRTFNMVPYFCPTWIARVGHVLEPIVESLPVARTILCGQYILVAEGIRR